MTNQTIPKTVPCWYCKGRGSLESKPSSFGTPMIMMTVKEGW